MKIELSDAEWDNVLSTRDGSALPGCCIQTRSLKWLLQDYREDPAEFEEYTDDVNDLARIIGIVFSGNHIVPSAEMVKVCRQLGFEAEVGRNVKVSKEALD